MGNIVQQELIPVDEISCMTGQENSIMASSRIERDTQCRCNDINYYRQLTFFLFSILIQLIHWRIQEGRQGRSP